MRVPEGMKEAKLIRKAHNELSGLRTDAVTGIYSVPPTVGVGFRLLGESLGFEGGLRLIVTSTVTEVKDNFISDEAGDFHYYEFKTLNSTYELYDVDRK